MDLYRQLAAEMLSVIDERHRVPPQDQVSNVLKGEMAVLRLLRSMRRSMSAGEISRELGMKTSRIAAVLNNLERKSMICRRANPSDRRMVNVEITQMGERFCEEKKRCACEDMARVLAYLGEADAREYIRILRRMNSVIIQLDQQCKGEELNEKE